MRLRAQRREVFPYIAASLRSDSGLPQQDWPGRQRPPRGWLHPRSDQPGWGSSAPGQSAICWSVGWYAWSTSALSGPFARLGVGSAIQRLSSTPAPAPHGALLHGT